MGGRGRVSWLNCLVSHPVTQLITASLPTGVRDPPSPSAPSLFSLYTVMTEYMSVFSCLGSSPSLISP